MTYFRRPRLQWEVMAPTSPALFVRSVELRNYKSIARCSVELRPLTLLVGRNASGKSNFLDSVRFVRDAVEHSLDYALRARGGLGTIRHRGAPEGAGVGVVLRLDLEGNAATYGFELTGNGDIASEKFEICGDQDQVVHSFDRVSDEVRVVVDGEPYRHPPQVLSHRLYLQNAGGIPVFEPFYAAIASMGFYNFEPATMRDLRSPEPEEPLRANGSNIATALRRLEEDAPGTVERIVQYLGVIVPGLVGMRVIDIGARETIEFDMVGEDGEIERFEAFSMSDGTLRALATLLAVQQRFKGKRSPFVGVEEPETALHPAATAALLDALSEATLETQVLVTSHSADLLDVLEGDERLLVVAAEAGETRIGPPDRVSQNSIDADRYHAGELLRMDYLRPAEDESGKRSEPPAPERYASAS